ncbi:bifunctional ornithine acetyltransferase/N-acetylglutamate synthase, partial [Mycolicibacterium gadium]|uniref:bifunctional ornithine acetyltransferase/N-acetylglutamate synthase n=1 Tax=Mycolicibacterium gadium TaxID=1794 RepID=UPI0021F2FECE
LDVDGSCSTNDTVLLLASGASEIAPSQDDLDAAVLRVCDDLCAQLQADAEGVTKRIAITVTGAPSDDDAVTAGRIIARDSASRTTSPSAPRRRSGRPARPAPDRLEIDAQRITVSFNGFPVCVDGA